MMSILVTLVFLGILIWAIGLLPIDAAIMQVIRAVAVIFAILWLCELFGVGPRLGRFR